MPSTDRAPGAPSGAVVVDSNFVGGGAFNESKIQHVAARLAKRGLDLIVPAVVVWEWAEHAVEDATQIAGHIQRSKTDVGLGLLPSTAPISDVATVVDDITRRISAIPGAFVQEPSPDSAVEAIKDQVLQTGTGSRSKGGTKTGAADHLVLACAEEMESSYDRVLLGTNDEHLAERAKKSGIDVARNQNVLWSWLGTMPPGALDLVDRIRELVALRIADADGDGFPSPLLMPGHERDQEVDHDMFGDVDNVVQFDLNLVDVHDLVVRDVEVVVGDELPRLVIAHVDADGILEGAAWRLDENGTLFSDDGAAEVTVSAPISVDFDKEWNPIAFEVDSDMWVGPRF